MAGRPRQHDTDALLDRAIAVMVERGVDGLTLRRLATESGASNGVIYHAFGSRSTLVAMAYAREAERFLALQLEVVAAARSSAPTDVAAPVVAAAQAPSTWARSAPTSAAFLLRIRHDDLLRTDLPDALRDRLTALVGSLSALVLDLAELTWGRRDRAALATIRACVVDLPSGLLMQRDQLLDPDAVSRVEAAVRGIVATVPPPRVRDDRA